MNKNTPGSIWGNKLQEGTFDNSAAARALFAQSNFHVTGTITSAAAATAVNLIPDSAIPSGKKVYVQGWIGKVDGATVWATTATVKIQDTNSSAVDFATMAVAGLTGNAVVGPHVAEMTSNDAFAEGTGGTAGKGLQLKGNANGTGSDLKVTVWGVIA